MVYKWYILPIGGLYATYHLLGEPETTIDIREENMFEPLPLRKPKNEKLENLLMFNS